MGDFGDTALVVFFAYHCCSNVSGNEFEEGGLLVGLVGRSLLVTRMYRFWQVGNQDVPFI